MNEWRVPFVIDGKPVPLAKAWYADWHPWRWGINLPVLTEALGSLEGKSVLDVGCQAGWYSFQAAEAGAEVLGIDLRSDAIDKANAIREHHGVTNPRFLQGNIEDATVDGNFDAVLNYGLLYHLADPISVMRRLGNATKRIMAIQTYIRTDRNPVLYLLKEGVHLPGKGATELITMPTQRAIVLMLKEAGFDRVYRHMPNDYRAKISRTAGGNGYQQWAFFYGVKGSPLNETSELIGIDENDPPLNHFGPLSRLYGLAKARIRRWQGRDTVGGF